MNKKNNEKSNLDLDSLSPQWIPIATKDKMNIEEELRQELSKKHVLFGQKCNALAKRKDTDDVLFYLPDLPKQFAVVHLSWTARNEENPSFPYTEFYDCIQGV